MRSESPRSGEGKEKKNNNTTVVAVVLLKKGQPTR
jgi:hypothetical protein